MIYDLSIDQDVSRFVDRVKSALKKSSKVDFKRYQETKTNRQNKYLYACFKVISDYTGYEIKEIKQIIKEECEFMQYTKNGKTFYKSIADLTKDQAMMLIDFTREFGDSAGCYVMTPEEYYSNQFSYDKELSYLDERS